MGVFASFCQICGLPLQHTCYIPYEGLFYIYRGPKSLPANVPQPAFPFAEEHTWLREAVALRLSPNEEPPVYRGEVQDGDLTDGTTVIDLEEGEGERAGLHARCWELAEHAEWSALKHLPESAAWKAARPYQGQLFEFETLMQDGNAWWAVDPMSATPDGRRNRERILGLLGRA